MVNNFIDNTLNSFNLNPNLNPNFAEEPVRTLPSVNVSRNKVEEVAKVLGVVEEVAKVEEEEVATVVGVEEKLVVEEEDAEDEKVEEVANVEAGEREDTVDKNETTTEVTENV